MNSHQRKIVRDALKREPGAFGLPAKVQHEADPPFSTPWTSKSLVILKKFWASILVVLTLIGGVTTYLGFDPDVSISPQQMINSDDPFSTTFYVANESGLSIHDVGFDCILNEIQVVNYHWGFAGFRAFGDPGTAPIIGPHKGQEVECHLSLNGTLIQAPPDQPFQFGVLDITVMATYKSILGIRSIQSERFLGKLDKNGKVVGWGHQAGETASSRFWKAFIKAH